MSTRLPVFGQDYKSTVIEHWFSYALVVPTILFLIFLLWIPFVRGIWMSFHSWPFIGDSVWVGLENYDDLFESDAFYTSIQATVLYWTSTLIQLGIALLAAILVNNIKKFENVVSGALLLPYTMPPVVTGTLWMFLLNPGVGPVSDFLVNQGFLQQPIYWSVDGQLALTVITLVISWTFWPFMFIILLASLQTIPEVHYESAGMYGANSIQMFRHITLPQIKSAILVVVSIRTVWNLAKISQPLQLTGGGPGYDTSVLGVLMYNAAYIEGAMGKSYTIGMILFLLTIAFVVVFIRELQKGGEKI